jgi:hypothetical protein
MAIYIETSVFAQRRRIKRAARPGSRFWRMAVLEIAHVRDLQMRDGAWKTAAHTKCQTCVQQVVIEVSD